MLSVMTEPTPDKAALRELAAARVAERRNRIRLIRKRTAATGAAIFAVAWGGLLVQLTTGNDPALENGDSTSADNTKSTSATSTSSASSNSATTNGTNSTHSSSFADDNGSSSAQAPSAVTTTQS
jgi:hypothetical protein